MLTRHANYNAGHMNADTAGLPEMIYVRSTVIYVGFAAATAMLLIISVAGFNRNMNILDWHHTDIRFLITLLVAWIMALGFAVRAFRRDMAWAKLKRSGQIAESQYITAVSPYHDHVLATVSGFGPATIRGCVNEHSPASGSVGLFRHFPIRIGVRPIPFSITLDERSMVIDLQHDRRWWLRRDFECDIDVEGVWTRSVIIRKCEAPNHPGSVTMELTAAGSSVAITGTDKGGG